MTAAAIATTKTILDALRPDQTPIEWESGFVKGQLDWHDLVVRAIVFGLAPQLHNRLNTWDIKLPPRAAAKLAVTYRAQQKRNASIYAQLAEALDACRQKGFRPIALKGVHLAACYYADPALRPMNDIDLLFAPAELPAVEALLADLGYGANHKSPQMGAGVIKHTSTFRPVGGSKGATSNPYLSTTGDRTIEPHQSLEEAWFGLKVNITPGIRERAETVTLAERECLALCPEDLLLHLCVHFCFHLIQGAPAMVQLTDLLAVSASGQVDWDLFGARVQRYRVAPYALAGLLLGNKLLSLPIPEATLANLAEWTPLPLRRRIRQMGLQTILRRTQQRPLTDRKFWSAVPRRIMRGFADRAEAAAWAQDWRSRMQVWRTLLQANRSDTGQMILGRLKPGSSAS
jgi:hypothetical protein